MTESIDCPECDGTGWVVTVSEDGTHSVRECKCQLERQWQSRIKAITMAARIPRRYAGRLLGQLDSARYGSALAIAREYVERWEEVRRSGKWLYITGPHGSGKTTLAYAIIQELLSRGIPCRCRTVPELLDALRPGNDTNAGSEIYMATDAEMLLLDDIGAQRTTEWATERLFIVVDYRYREMLPAVVTSNLSLRELSGIPGWERIADRLAEIARIMRLDGVVGRRSAYRESDKWRR